MIGVGTAKFAWGIFAAWFVGLTVLSSIPGQHFGESPFSLADKVVHIGLFATGACLLAIALLRTLRLNMVAIGMLAWVAMVWIGVLDEYHQLFTPGRSGMDAGDICADAIGAGIGVVCACLFHARRRTKTNLGTAGADRAA